jgi:hypothetical protein
VNNIPTDVSTHTYVAEGGIAVHRILRLILGVIIVLRPYDLLHFQLKLSLNAMLFQKETMFCQRLGLVGRCHFH